MEWFKKWRLNHRVCYYLEVNTKVTGPERGVGLNCPGAKDSAWQAAIDSGFDMSLVELSLALTPWERLLEHDDAQAFAARLRAAMTDSHAKSE